MTNGKEPAFPWEEQDSCGNPVRRHPGINKREMFAMAAMPKMMELVFDNHGATTDQMLKRAAEISIRGADALLEALEEKK